jgi:hypothetical protein
LDDPGELIYHRMFDRNMESFYTYYELPLN